MNWAEVVGWAWGLGYRIAIPVVGFTLGGRLLDRRLGTTPWLLILGIVFAIFVSVVWVAYTLRPLLREGANSTPEDKRGSGAEQQS